jgi:RNA polymerase sigma factor (sigma-70 family)
MAARHGDDRARDRFNEVVSPYLDDAFSLARWMTGNPADAEDVVQDACLRAFNGIAGYSGGSKRAWLLAIVRNTALAWLVKNRPKAVVTVDDLEAFERDRDPAATTADSPEAVYIAKVEAERLEAAIAALPSPYRETIVMREINGASYREIAEITKVPIGTVMSRLARARARLVAALAVPMT